MAAVPVRKKCRFLQILSGVYALATVVGSLEWSAWVLWASVRHCALGIPEVLCLLDFHVSCLFGKGWSKRHCCIFRDKSRLREKLEDSMKMVADSLDLYKYSVCLSPRWLQESDMELRPSMKLTIIYSPQDESQSYSSLLTRLAIFCFSYPRRAGCGILRAELTQQLGACSDGIPKHARKCLPK